jgi:hypothetical protein
MISSSDLHRERASGRDSQLRKSYWSGEILCDIGCLNLGCRGANPNLLGETPHYRSQNKDFHDNSRNHHDALDLN